MKLNKKNLLQKEAWDEMGISLPTFDLDGVAAKTASQPSWIHFGGGNIFRAFIANAYQDLLDQGLADTGIIAVESFDHEVTDRVYRAFDNLSILVNMSSDGKFSKKVIASVSESLAADFTRSQDIERLTSIFENPSLQMVSFTITEKGYALKDPNGEFFSFVLGDLENGPGKPSHTMSMITAFAYKRYLAGKYPVTFVSMDNCSHNGDKLKEAVITIAKEWAERDFVEAGFVDYITDESLVTFPLSMIDKITPRPSDTVKDVLEADGLEDMDVIITERRSYMAPFVNAEIPQYLIVEDKFTNGRPALDKAGVIFTSRDTVNQTETMKVTTCLNPLHTALAVTGCLLDYHLIADQMKDETLVKLIKRIGYTEGLPVVVDPKIIDPKAFIDEVVEERFTNPFIPDTPQRIATDTSQKVGIRFGETIKSYIKDESLDPSSLIGIPLAIAAWLRYLVGINDKGQTFELSPDPLKDTLLGILGDVQLGDKPETVKEIIGNVSIFGSDLYVIGLGDKIEAYFYEMMAGIDGVRRTLDKYL